MSGFADSDKCPNCGNQADVYTDYKPISYTSYTCLYCGLMIDPILKYMSLKTLNEYRQDMELPRIRKKPKQEYKLFE